jgi:hypothetical protein
LNRQWFDEATGYLILDEHMEHMPSFQKVLANGAITLEELREQAETVAKLFRQLERGLTPELRARITEALCELAVLHALQQRFLQQSRSQDRQGQEDVQVG